MSVLIKGMDMPQGNSTINVLIYADGTVYTGHINDSRYSAVSVPTPHGRLIDADELKTLSYEVLVDANNPNRADGLSACNGIVEDDIDLAPTIIEAESEK